MSFVAKWQMSSSLTSPADMRLGQRLVEWLVPCQNINRNVGCITVARDLRQRIEASVEQQMTDPNGCQLRRMRADVGSIPDRGNLFGNLVPGRTKHLL
jgi:hypothetical protein